MARFSIQADADGRSLDEFAKTLQRRMRYLNETSFQAIHAMAIEALKSIRAATRVAKPNGLKVDVTRRTDLAFSFSRQGGTRKMCLRDHAGVRQVFEGVKVVYDDVRGARLSDVSVFDFTDDYATTESKRYLICARSPAAAKKRAKLLVAKRVLRYAGLAKRAISTLMIKTNTKGPADAVSMRVYAKALEVTSARNLIAKDTSGGGVYSLVLTDDLRYAKRAIKGGDAAVNLALQKAANSSVGLIKKKCGALLAPGELATPFPEIRRRAS